MRTIFRLSAVLAVFAVAPAFAEGTAEQKAACENDAYRLCESAVPDPVAIEKCLAAQISALSADCRSEFTGGASAKKSRKR
ncbi:hypothetical protein LBMAG20_09830 [Methylocystaceae bacterium]|nr:hypothetical protein LBMAG20_09830 [Methylocystaceae bacterium]